MDLSILTNALLPRDRLVEPDTKWEFETLLDSLAQAHQLELDQDDKEKETD